MKLRRVNGVYMQKLLHGDYRSVVDAITARYLEKCEEMPDPMFPFPFWIFTVLDLRDRFMTIDQINFIYHEGELNTFRQTDCKRCLYETPEIQCKGSDEEVESCWQIKEDIKMAAKWRDF